MGVYLQTLTANDAFYNKGIYPLSVDENPTELDKWRQSTFDC